MTEKAILPAALYSDEDRDTWATLFDGFIGRLPEYGCGEVVEGFERLGLGREAAGIEDMSRRVHDLCGWRLQAVDGLLPEREFFELLRQRVYPMAAQLRKPHELDFAMLPDTFHDALGHLPLLVHPPYTRFLEQYAAIVYRHIDSPRVVQAFGRLYWYTTETGLVMQGGRPRVYGAAVLTSGAECEHACSDASRKLPLDVDVVFDTPYDNYQLQPWYFVIDSLDHLLSVAEELEARAARLA